MTTQLSLAPELAPRAKQATPTTRLLKMLSYARPANSVTETEFIAKYIAPIGADPDDHGNYWLALGQSKVLWSCHTDTVHAHGGRQKLRIANGVVTAEKKNCLGADCTVGVWIMLEMIAARVPGTYVFHREEERGGKGSSHIAKNYPETLSCYDFAIAFDRRGTNSVITHQMGQRGASEAFVKSITPMLPKGYYRDSGGLFTDTANYVDHIAECTNLSVGYDDEHTSRESLNLPHALALLNAMLVFDESKLVAARDPTKTEFDESWYKTDWWDDYPANHNKPQPTWSLDDYRDLLAFVRSCPDAVADFLEAKGYTMGDLEEWRGC